MEKLVIINDKRYYEFDMLNELPNLEETIPYYFKYDDIEIYELSWNKMAVRIVEELNKKYPHDDEWFLNIKYNWSKTDVFSREKQSNFSECVNLFLNTNHTATHSMMSIQCLLNAFGINLEECYFLIKRHSSAEPVKIRELYRNKTIEEFSKALRFKNKSDENIKKIILNFTTINKLLCSISRGFDDFFLFDDYSYFYNYKHKVIEFACKKFCNKPKNIDIVKKNLNYLDDFYKNYSFYRKVCDLRISPDLKIELDQEIKFLFENLNTTAIVSSKLFARMNIMHENSMKKLNRLNNAEDLYKIAESFLGKQYFFKYPIIAKSQESYASNDEIILNYIKECKEFSIDDINCFADKNHLNRPTNYLKLISDLSSIFVQINQNSMIKKEIFNLSKENIIEIKLEIEFYIKSFGKIITKNYKGYNSLPDIGYEWNKYLLIGVLKTYLSNFFSIVNLSNNYRTADYEVDLL